MMRDGVAFADPQEYIDFLRSLADRAPGSTVVFADDGERFGGWSNTSDRSDRRRWLERFCDILLTHRDWLELATFATAADRSLPVGKVYPSDSASGWRNSQARYPESDEIYARMLGISNRLTAVESNAESDPDYLEMARDELYRGQCHDAYAYGHGISGGLNQPRLRNAVYRHLIAADNALDEAEGKIGPRVRAEAGDFNLDARQEVRLENDRLIALVRPAHGGHIYELDLREPLLNMLATLDRRREPEPATTAGELVYDRHPRKALVDHFYPVEATLADLIAGHDLECGDFALGTYPSRIRRQPDRVSLIMERVGRAGNHSIRIRKMIALGAGDAAISVHYQIENIPPGACLHFAVEINLAGLPGHERGVEYSDPTGAKLGVLDATLDLPHSSGLSLRDRSLDLSVLLTWSQSAGLWCFPIETVSREKGRNERNYQSSAVIPHWHVTPDDDGRWDVMIGWSVEDAASAPVRRTGSEYVRGSRARLSETRTLSKQYGQLGNDFSAIYCFDTCRRLDYDPSSILEPHAYAYTLLAVSDARR